MPVASSYQPAPRYAALGDRFFDVVRAAEFPERALRFRNQRWAERVGLGTLDAAEWEAHFARFEPLPSNLPQPLALRYHGHQFDVYNPGLGDGRGFLFAQVVDDAGRLLDLGTKGSGRTPYSRGGDGRLTLKGGVREVLCTEMLEALGVYTSKSFSLFETAESLYRNDEPSPTRSSVLVRLSHSHVRIGTFQRLLYENDAASVRALLEYCAEHLLPELSNHAALPLAFLREVSRRSAELCAEWLVAGFVHGVLNSDNMTVTGESFDYGPYRFLPHYDPSFVAAYFDQVGLYAFGRQPRAVYRNMQRLAQALSLLDPGAGWERALDAFVDDLERARARKLVRRLGVLPGDPDDDHTLAEACWDFLARRSVGYDEFFFDWWGGPASSARALSSARAPSYAAAEFSALRRLLEGRSPAGADRLGEPYFQGDAPCSLLIDEIEAIFSAVAERNDFGPFEQKLERIRELGAATAVAS
ncbi:MAG TPA: YdiU family protein [Polyangiaceae bacterium]|nr:YdiU family protein [Polyangiaceae bacterium]